MTLSYSSPISSDDFPLGDSPSLLEWDACCAERLQQSRWSIRKVFCSARCDSDGHSADCSQEKSKGEAKWEHLSDPGLPLILLCRAGLLDLHSPSKEGLRVPRWQTHRWQDVCSVLCHSQLTGHPLKSCPPPFQGANRDGRDSPGPAAGRSPGRAELSVCSVGLPGDPTGGVYIPLTNLCSVHLPLRRQPCMCSCCSV